MKRDYTINTIVQMSEVLTAISDNRQPMTLADAVKATGLSQNTVFRILSTLESIKYVERVGDHYKLGMGVAVLWARYKTRLESERDDIDRKLSELEVEDAA